MPTADPPPPRQRPGTAFPRFGARPWAPLLRRPAAASLQVSGDVEAPGELAAADLAALDRRRRVSDLHCVTTWTKPALEWEGIAFRQLWERLLLPRFRPHPEVAWVVCFGADGYRATLALEDALADGVLLADRLDGEPLGPAHGAPLRLVSPAQYAYKSVKQVAGFALRRRPPKPLPLGLEHLRGRVEMEERHASLPARLVRFPYRLLIGPVAASLRRGLALGDYAGRPTLLDQVMPGWDFHELHDAWLDAPVPACWEALAATTGREVRLLAPLLALRRLPARLLGRPALGDDRGEPLFTALEKGGFVRLAEEPGREIVFGVVGRFWRPAGNAPVRAVTDRDRFEHFAEPGYARAAMSFLARREGAGTRLLTETRIAATDAAARRRFRLYWRLVRPGSGAIRRSWLAAVRRRLARRGGALHRR